MQIYVANGNVVSELAWPVWQHIGADVRAGEPGGSAPDVIICPSVTQMGLTRLALKRWPGVPLFTYQWDTYSWVWNPAHKWHVPYDYTDWGRLLHESAVVWVPSWCTAQQAMQWWALPAGRFVVIRAAPNSFEHETKDGGYALCTLRKLPDRLCDEFARRCTSAGIPYQHTDHNLSAADFQKVVAECRFIVSHYEEASTGSLALLEAYRLGKPVLANASALNATSEYFGSRAQYFIGEDGLEQALIDMHRNPPPVPSDCKEWVDTTFSHANMAKAMRYSIDQVMGGQAMRKS